MLLAILILALLNFGLAYNHANHYHEQDPLSISTPWGKIMGSTLTSRLNKTFYAFRGIKYANAERFEDPVMVPKWNGLYNATYDRPSCPQPTTDPVSEDCLHLNVYTKMLPNKQQPHPKTPVIIELYPGAFYSGTSRSDRVGPQYFMDRDIILVTLNYRLGALGFISTGTKDATGNYGLKDQVVAIKWVKENIAAFGGDPDSITLYGSSAGAWSITLHMISPMIRGKGLFHKGVLASSSSLGIFPLPKHQLHLARKQARILECPDDTPANIIKCLKTKPAEEIGKSLNQLLDLGILWTTVIEEDFGQERFLTEDPVEVYRRGDFEKIPIMAGVTEDEFGAAIFEILADETIINWLNTEFEKYAPIMFGYETDDVDKANQVSKAIRKFYFNDQPIANDSQTRTALAELYSDSVIGVSVNRAVNLISQKNPLPVFYYKFAYQGRYSYFYIPDSNNKTWGVIHTDDLIYLFYNSRRFPFFDSTYPEAKMVEKLTTIISNFALTGNPTPRKSATLDNVIWPPYDQKTRKYLNIGDKLVVQENMFQKRYSFWEKLYPTN